MGVQTTTLRVSPWIHYVTATESGYFWEGTFAIFEVSRPKKQEKWQREYDEKNKKRKFQRLCHWKKLRLPLAGVSFKLNSTNTIKLLNTVRVFQYFICMLNASFCIYIAFGALEENIQGLYQWTRRTSVDCQGHCSPRGPLENFRLMSSPEYQSGTMVPTSAY